MRLACICILLFGTTAAVAQTSRPVRRMPDRPQGIPANVTATRGIVYVEGGGASQSLDIFVPKDTKNPPLIVFVHGGGWSAGSKEQNPAMQFTRSGFAVASINYRLTREAIFPAQIADCRAAIRYLRSHAKEYGYDGDRIGVWGTSAGGHLVALLGTGADVKELDGDNKVAPTSCAVQAVADFFGPTDLLAISNHPSTIKHHDASSPESRLLGGPPPEKRELAALANPITHIGKNVPPFLIMHGDKDPLVPLNQSELLNNALKKANADVEFQVVEGAGHGFAGPKVSEKLLGFFEKSLKH